MSRYRPQFIAFYKCEIDIKALNGVVGYHDMFISSALVWNGALQRCLSNCDNSSQNFRKTSVGVIQCFSIDYIPVTMQILLKQNF